ncbi:response regulator [Desulforhopalus singaporensis]|uniref:Two component transcriptional regulator, LuxR family n=1 Tax=Desulforhopalus singaporensis TaxID=91360 RepID=A0A1H0SHI3_9BACT|nr:response regulator transcription factor [Desulforhopalus singaporensis]SDP41251.1 two component transcriptional regulator, LuxR family [Desulforhopalus singaporensis]
MDIKILVVDDHKITRDGLCALIEKQPDLKIVGEADNGRDAVKLTRKLEPDVVVMDISMPNLNGIDATRQIVALYPDIKVITLSMYSDKRYVQGMLRAGVSGYLLKNCAFNELVKAIKMVISGQSYMSAEIAHIVMKDYTQSLNRDDTSPAEILTLREREVLQLIAEGLSSEQIASRLFLSVKTVSTHRRKIMEKLKIDNLADLVKFALREGLISLEI